jgi:FtsH-binding integral membrane protein
LPVSEAPAETRADFIKKTYSHVAAACVGLVALELLYFAVIPDATLAQIAGFMLAGFGGFAWVGVLVLFAIVSGIASKMAVDGADSSKAYVGLTLYTVAQSIILLPLLVLASMYTAAGQDATTFGLIPTAAVITLLMVGGLTAFVFMTGANFNWLGGIITIGVIGMLLLFGASLIFGFQLGIAFIIFGVVLMAASVLYQTSNVMHEYPVGSHVAASLALFASIATLFFYVLQLLMYLQNDD